MINNKGENTFLKICVPLDESITALCSDKNDSCFQRAKYAEKIKLKNEDYISRIKSNYFTNRKVDTQAAAAAPAAKYVIYLKKVIIPATLQITMVMPQIQFTVIME